MQLLSGIAFITLAIETLTLAAFQWRTIRWYWWLPLVGVANLTSFFLGLFFISLLYPILPWDHKGLDLSQDVLAWIVAFVVSVGIEYGVMRVLTRRWQTRRLFAT